MIRKPYDSVSKAHELPTLIMLEKNLYVASFFLMKLLPARFMLDRARDLGHLRQDSTIIETTSGTFGLGLAILCALRNYRLILVSDPVIDVRLRRRLEDLGARVDIVEHAAEAGGYQRKRLDRVNELCEQYPNHYCPLQYDNPHNPGAYAALAELLVESIGSVDCLVGTTGSGGSMCGTSFYLRQVFPRLKAIGVDTPGSVLFGHEDKKRILRGLGNSLMPKNLDHSTFDEVHWVSAAEAFYATRILHHKYAIYMGPTSGAAYMVAQRWSRLNPGATAVCLLPDEGHRYSDTVYCDEWLKSNDLLLREMPTEPRLVDHPTEVVERWCYLRWGRRTLDQVINGTKASLQ